MYFLSEVFSSFTDTNYMSVFAIALPFTNPHKFDAYTVSLAHHVIIMWFLKCRLAYRQNFVQFIIIHLNSNILQPLEEGSRKYSNPSSAAAAAAKSAAAAAAAKQAEADAAELRKRSSSLSDHR